MKDADLYLEEPQLRQYFRRDLAAASEPLVPYYKKGPQKHGLLMSMVGLRLEHYKIISGHSNLQMTFMANAPAHPLISIYTEKSKPVYEWFGIDRSNHTNVTRRAQGATLYALAAGYRAALVEKYLFGEVRLSESDEIISNTSCHDFLVQLTKIVREETEIHFRRLIEAAASDIMTPARKWELHRENRKKRMEAFLRDTGKVGETLGPLAPDILAARRPSASEQQVFVVLRYLIDSGFYFGRLTAMEKIQKYLLETA